MKTIKIIVLSVVTLLGITVEAKYCYTWSQVKSALTDGETAKLLSNLDATSELDLIGCSAKLDLNGHNLYFCKSGCRLFSLKNARLEIVGDGCIENEAGTYSGGGQFAYVEAGSQLVIKDYVYIKHFASSGNVEGNKGGAICCNGGTVELADIIIENCRGATDSIGAIYVAQGTLNITSPNGKGWISSPSGVAICVASAASANISGGSIVTSSGNSMLVESENCRITGGYFRGAIDRTVSKGFIYGGVFSNEPPVAFLGDDCEKLQLSSSLYIVGRASSLAKNDNGELTSGVLTFDPQEEFYSNVGLKIASTASYAALPDAATPFVASVYSPIGVCVDGTDVGVGYGSNFDFRRNAKTLTLTSNACTVSGQNKSGDVRIIAAVSSAVTLDNLDLENVTSGSPFTIADGTDTTIYLKGTNYLKTSTNPYTGLRVGVGSSVTLNKATGETDEGACLNVQGGDLGAGIGCGRSSSCGTITINGGSIWAYSLGNAAGIGSACGGNSGVITINGGIVRAFGGTGGAGIGAGTGNCYEDSRTAGIVINGGDVSALSGGGAAGIGAGYVQCGNASCGYITINGGKVYARSQSSGSGIGSGYGSAYTSTCGIITITGGTVEGVGANGANGIGLAQRGAVSGITITGGSVKGSISPTPTGASGATAYKVEVSGKWAKNEFVEIVGVTAEPQTLQADDYGRVTLYLENGDYRFTVNGDLWQATVAGASTQAVKIGVGVKINGVDVAYGSGTGWTYSDQLLTLDQAIDYTLSGTNQAAIAIRIENNAEVTLDNFVCTNTVAEGPASIIECTANAQARLVLKGVNRIYSKNDTSAYAVSVVENAALVISGEGSLNVDEGDAINDDGSLVMEGGLITCPNNAIVVDGVCTNYGGVIAGEISTSDSTKVVTYGAVADRPMVGTLMAKELQQFSIYIYGDNMQTNSAGELIAGAFTFNPLDDEYAESGVQLASGFSVYKKGDLEYVIIGETGVLLDGVDLATGSGSGWNSDCQSQRLTLTDSSEHLYEDELHQQQFDVRAASGIAAKLRVSGQDGYALLTNVGDGVTIVGGTAKISQSAISGLCITGGSVLISECDEPISNGTARVYAVTLNGDWENGTAVALAGLPSNYDVSGIVAIDGKITVWLPSGTYYFTVDGARRTAEVTSNATTIYDYYRTGVMLDGVDVGQNDDYDFDSRTFTFNTANVTNVLSGTNTSGMVKIVVAANAAVVCDNLNLSVSEAAIKIVDGVTATVLLKGENSLTSASRNAGIELHGSGANVVIDKVAGLTDAEATLTVRAGGNAAGIGSMCNVASGLITINGGTITAYGGTGGAGIGAGTGNKSYSSPSAGITINGGRITANGGSGASGIGAGYVQLGNADCGFVKINGGLVVANSGYHAAGIGAGYSSTWQYSNCNTIEITAGTVVATGGDYAEDIGEACRGKVNYVKVTGGSVVADDISPQPTDNSGKVWQVTVDGGWANGAAVTVTGLPDDFKTKDIYSVYGKICLYLPNGDYSFKANGTKYSVSVADGKAVAKEGWPTGVTVNGRDVVYGGSNWNFDSDTGIVSLNGENATFVVNGTNEYNSVRLLVEANSTVVLSNLVLRGLDEILIVHSNCTANVLVTGENTLLSRCSCAIHVKATATISIDSLEKGELDNAVLNVISADEVAIGGPYVSNETDAGDVEILGGRINLISGGDSAISGGYTHAIGTIRIAGGEIYAAATTNSPTAAVIGSSYFGKCSGVEISGGTLVTYGGKSGIGNGHWDKGWYDGCGFVRITGGSISGSDYSGDSFIYGPIASNDNAAVHQVLVPGEWSDHERITVAGLPDEYGTDDLIAENGAIALWLADGTYRFDAGDYSWSATVAGADTTARIVEPTGVTLNGTDVGELSEYDHETKTLTLGATAATNELSGINWSGDVRVVVTGNQTLRFNDLQLAGENRAVSIAENAEVTLLIAGTNILESTEEATMLVNGSVVIRDDSAVEPNVLLSTSISGAGSIRVEGSLVESFVFTPQVTEITGGSLWVQTIGGSNEVLKITGGSLLSMNVASVPSNATERVYKVTVPGAWAEGELVELSGIDGYGTNDLFAVSGAITLWLPNGLYQFSAGGHDWTAEVEGGDTVAVSGSLIGVSVNGRDVVLGSGSGWTFADGLLTLTEAGQYVISGANETDAVRVRVRADATVILNELTLIRNADDRAVISIDDSRTVNLRLNGKNTLIGGASSTNHEPCLMVGANALLIIDADDGLPDAKASLIATCRGTNQAGAGIGSWRWCPVGGNVRILGGTITAQGGYGGAGIGSGYNGKFKSVEVCGGTVTAVGGTAAAGLGSGIIDGEVAVSISGGFVKATGGSSASDIGGAYKALTNGTINISGGTVLPTRGTIGGSGSYSSSNYGHYTTTITGGNILATTIDPVPSNGVARVYKVTVNGTWPDMTAVSVIGLPADYGIADVVAYDGKLAFWLPDGDYSFTVDDIEYVANVNGADVIAGSPRARVTQADGAVVNFATFAAAYEFATNGAAVELLTDITDERLAISLSGKNLTILGNNHLLELITDNGSEIFKLESGVAMSVEDLCFANGAASLFEVDSAALSLTNVVITGFAATNDALIVIRDSSADIVGLTATNNSRCSAIIECANADAAPDACRLVTGTFADNGSAVTLHLVSGVCLAGSDYTQDQLVSVEHNGELALLGDVPGEVKLEVPSAIYREGDLLITNLTGTANIAAANVRICTSGYTAVGDDGNIYLASSTNFLYAVRPADSFIVYRTFDEALAAGGSVVSLVHYRNEPQGIDLATQDDPLTIGAGTNVVLRTVLRTTPDGTNTTWNASTTEAVTLTGALTVAGRVRLENIRLAGTLMLAGGVLDVGESFALDESSVMVELAAGIEPGGQVAIVSSVYTGEELYQHFHLSEGDLVFRVTENGLIVVKLEDKVARVGTYTYDTFAEAVQAVTNAGVVEIIASTNAISGEYREEVKFGYGVTVPANKSFTVRSIRATLDDTQGKQVVVDDNPTIPTVLNLDGGSLELGAGSRLALTNVITTGTLALSGEGLLDFECFTNSVFYVKPSHTGLIATNVSDHSLLQLGTGATGVIVWKGNGAWWRDGSFTAKFVQSGNGTGSIEIDDYGIYSSIDVISTTGSYAYHYQETAGKTGTDTNLEFGVVYCVIEEGKTPYVIWSPDSCYDAPGESRPTYQDKNGNYVNFEVRSGKGYFTSELPRSGEKQNHQSKVSFIVRNYDAPACEVGYYYIVDEEKDVEEAVDEASEDEDVKSLFWKIWDISDGILDTARLVSIITGVLTEYVGYNIISWGQAIKAFADIIIRVSCDCYVNDAGSTSNYYCEKDFEDAFNQAVSEGPHTVYTFWDVYNSPNYTLKENKQLKINGAGMPLIDTSAIASCIVGLGPDDPVTSVVVSEIVGFVVKELSKAGQSAFEGHALPHAIKAKDSSGKALIIVNSGATLSVTKIDESGYGSSTKLGTSLFDVYGTLNVSDSSFDDRAISDCILRVRNGGKAYFDNVDAHRSGACNCYVEAGGRVYLDDDDSFCSRIGISGLTENSNVFSTANFQPTSTNSYAKCFFNDAYETDKYSLGIDPATHDIFWNIVRTRFDIDLNNLPVFDTQAEVKEILPIAFVLRPNIEVVNVIGEYAYNALFTVSDIPKAGTSKYTVQVDLQPDVSNIVQQALNSAMSDLAANVTNEVPSAKVWTQAGLYYGIGSAALLDDLPAAVPSWHLGLGFKETIYGTRPSATNGFYRLRQTILP